MRVDFPGLLIESHRNGSPRYRVRVEGRKHVRIHLPVGPEDKDFANYYHAARAGERWLPSEPKTVKGSIDWLCAEYLSFVARMVEAEQMSPATLKQRRSVLRRLCDYSGEGSVRYGDFDMDAPAAAFIEIRDAWATHPGAADNLIKTVRAVYTWAQEREYIRHNPAAAIKAINVNPAGGAVPWSVAELKKFREHHPKGTAAHLWLTLHAFTACRIGDAIWLGRAQEVTRDGQLWLSWQPRKRGSAFVSIPMMPPLIAATRSSDGPAYLLNDKGKPFASVEALRVRVQRWCSAAGIPDRSSHGIRKAVGEMMAQNGCSQYQVMAVMAHTQAKTSEIYTKGAERQILAADGVKVLAALDW